MHTKFLHRLQDIILACFRQYVKIEYLHMNFICHKHQQTDTIKTMTRPFSGTKRIRNSESTARCQSLALPNSNLVESEIHDGKIQQRDKRERKLTSTPFEKFEFVSFSPEEPRSSTQQKQRLIKSRAIRYYNARRAQARNERKKMEQDGRSAKKTVTLRPRPNHVHATTSIDVEGIALQSKRKSSVLSTSDTSVSSQHSVSSSTVCSADLDTKSEVPYAYSDTVLTTNPSLETLRSSPLSWDGVEVSDILSSWTSGFIPIPENYRSTFVDDSSSSSSTSPQAPMPIHLNATHAETALFIAEAMESASMWSYWDHATDMNAQVGLHTELDAIAHPRGSFSVTTMDEQYHPPVTMPVTAKGHTSVSMDEMARLCGLGVVPYLPLGHP
jgi:hypothetical protein